MLKNLLQNKAQLSLPHRMNCKFSLHSGLFDFRSFERNLPCRLYFSNRSLSLSNYSLHFGSGLFQAFTSTSKNPPTLEHPSLKPYNSPALPHEKFRSSILNLIKIFLPRFQQFTVKYELNINFMLNRFGSVGLKLVLLPHWKREYISSAGGPSGR